MGRRLPPPPSNATTATHSPDSPCSANFGLERHCSCFNLKRGRRRNVWLADELTSAPDVLCGPIRTKSTQVCAFLQHFWCPTFLQFSAFLVQRIPRRLAPVAGFSYGSLVTGIWKRFLLEARDIRVFCFLRRQTLVPSRRRSLVKALLPPLSSPGPRPALRLSSNVARRPLATRRSRNAIKPA